MFGTFDINRSVSILQDSFQNTQTDSIEIMNRPQKEDSVTASSSVSSSSSKMTHLSKEQPLPSQYPSRHHQIRSRYLNRLGLPPQPHTIRKKVQSNDIPIQIEGIEILKDDYGAVDDSLTVHSPPLHSPSSFSNGVKRQKVVSFEAKVICRDIPSHRVYSDRLKNTIWTAREEYNESTRRNLIEYMSEGCNPNGVIEEQHFVRHNDQLIHPSHFVQEPQTSQDQ